MRLALALSAARTAGFEADAARHGHDVLAAAGSGFELLAVLPSLNPEVAIVAAHPLFLTEAVLAACDQRGIRLITVIEDESDRRRASALGLYEFLDADAEWPVVEQTLGGMREPTPPTRTAENGHVIAVWGPAGAPGRTSVAIGIAAELALAGHSVALVDVDTHGASIAPALGLLDESPGFAAACRLAGADALTTAELERIGQRYTVGGSRSAARFWVLTGIGRASRWPELSADRVTGTIDACRRWVDFVILDTSASLENDEEISSDLFAPRRNAATIAALGAADQTIAVGAADPVGLSRFLRAHVDLLETIQTDAVAVVMNKVRSSAIGLNPSGQVIQTLARFGGIESPVLIPHDQAGFDAAILAGRTLAEVAPKSPARAALQLLVSQHIAGAETPTFEARVIGSRIRLRPHRAS